MKAAFLTALLLAGAVSPAMAQQTGEWVLAQYKGGSYWFPGVIQSVNAGSLTIMYDDGMKETRPANQVRPYDWSIGTPVECNWRNEGKWYPGKITGLKATSLTIRYDDGDVETTRTGQCRSG